MVVFRKTGDCRLLRGYGGDVVGMESCAILWWITVVVAEVELEGCGAKEQ